MAETIDVPFAVSEFEVKQDGDSEVGTFRGLASTFGNVDLVNDIIEPGAFAASIKTPSKIRMLWQHDTGQPLGTWEEIRETARGLQVKGKLVLGVQRAKEAFELMKAGAIGALSIGFRIPDRDKDVSFDRSTGVRRISKLDLLEVSIVTFPANPKAVVQSVKSAIEAGEVPARPDLERALRHEFGFSQRQAKKLLSGGYAELDPEAEQLDGLMASIERLRKLMAG